MWSFIKARGAVLILLAQVFLFSCNSTYTAKPRGYFKIALPQKGYTQFDKPGFPYTFEYPIYASVVQDTSFFEEKPENPYWININFPQFGGKIYISYNQIGGRAKFKIKDKAGKYIDSMGVNTFAALIKGAYDLTFKHAYKASSIDDSVFRTRNGVDGIFFKIGGNTATANQFLVTDSVRNFLRGALYFDATPNEDSLSIVNQFLQQDVRHLVNTLKWR